MPPAAPRLGAALAALAVAVLSLAGGTAVARDAAPSPSPAYEHIAASADGTGVRYMGREIARIMGWQGAAWLERDERAREERTDLLLPALRLAPGMTVADIGAGTGYVARRMAALVGPAGIVDAVDVQPEMVRMLAALAERDRLPQIRPVLGAVFDEDDTPARLQCPHDARQHLERALQLMIDVDHDGHVDARRREFHVVGGAEDRADLRQPVALG